ncbi:MAG: transposase [Xenococcaceae cyanobacterium MO_234.B1]|nr:transposase [Xenococcaceae cyanobacterium MO_234.B1]
MQCPRGKSSSIWKERLNLYQQPVIYVRFNKSNCQNCPARPDCTRDKTGVRTLTLRPKQLHETLFAARARQQTPEFKEQYKARAGIEGTISQGTRAFGLRRSRYRGFPKTRLQHIITACAINLVRVWEWWTGTYTFGTRPERFAELASIRTFCCLLTRAVLPLPRNTW